MTLSFVHLELGTQLHHIIKCVRNDAQLLEHNMCANIPVYVVVIANKQG